MVSVLATFNITEAVDEHGQVIKPSYEYTEGIIRCENSLEVFWQKIDIGSSAPVPFKCSIQPRSQTAAKLVQATATYNI